MQLAQAAPNAGKITAFREFASTLAAQVVEQLCTEYEREVNVMYEDLMAYRGELQRVAELLGHQLGREKQLHDMMEHMYQLHGNLAQQAHQKAALTPGTDPLHDYVDQVVGQHSAISSTMLDQVNQAANHAQNQVMNARQMREPMINAENEFNRICKLLEEPMLSLGTVQPTLAQMPRLGGGGAQAPGYARPLVAANPPMSPAPNFVNGSMNPMSPGYRPPLASPRGQPGAVVWPSSPGVAQQGRTQASPQAYPPVYAQPCAQQQQRYA